MKKIVAWTGSALCVVALALGVSAESGGRGFDADNARAERSGRGCDNGDLQGTYGFSRSGTTTQGPLAAVGSANFDGSGFFSVTQTTSRNGVFTQGGFDGLYEVTADCTGRWLTLDGQGVTAYFVLVDYGDEIFFLSASAGNTVTGVSKRITRRYGR